jgi:hypothetical protein
MISGALTLLTNAVIAYNTWKLNQLRFPLERYLDRLVPSALTHPIAVGAK